jgi:hypothetical protein
MEQPPPLTPQEISEFAGSEYAQLGQPQTVKVLGIMHLIFGAYGVFAIVWSWFIIIAGNPFLKLAGNSPEMQMQAKLQADMSLYTLMSAVLLVGVTALIIPAGIMLLKGRKNGLKWSNAYAWTSIGTKILNMIVTLFYVMPLTHEIMGQATTSAGAGMAGMKMIMTGSMIVGLLLPLIYPVLTLILLNRPNVKTWFANQPT